jgi:hypothetical protein
MLQQPASAARPLQIGQEGASHSMDRHQNQRWTFLSNHARVLLAFARNPAARLQDVAAGCRISERTAQRIVARS